MRRMLIILAVSLSSGAATAETHIVRIVSDYENLRFVFEPTTLTINPGDTVTWVNEVAEEHNVITYPGGYPASASGFQSPYLTKAGDTYSATFPAPGTYQYHCLPHLLMGMRGEIIVGRRSELAEFHIPSRQEVKAYQTLLYEWFDEDDNLFEVRIDEKVGRNISSSEHGH